MIDGNASLFKQLSETKCDVSIDMPGQDTSTKIRTIRKAIINYLTAIAFVVENKLLYYSQSKSSDSSACSSVFF